MTATSRDRWLLRACLWPDARAIAAWSAWGGAASLDRATPGATRLLPLLAWNLREQGLADSAFPGRLRGLRRHAFARGEREMGAAASLAARFASEGFAPIWIKGAALRLGWYPPATRPIAGVALQVAPERVGSALRLAEEAGFASRLPDPARALAAQHAVSLADAAGSRIALHRRMLRECADAAADAKLLRGAAPVPGTDRLVPSAEALFVAACVCGPFSPARPPLLWLADCARLASAGFSGTRLADLALEVGVAPAVSDGIAALREALGPKLLADAAARLSTDRPPLHDRMRHRIATSAIPAAGPLPALWLAHRRLAKRAAPVGFARFLSDHFEIATPAALPGFLARAAVQRWRARRATAGV